MDKWYTLEEKDIPLNEFVLLHWQKSDTYIMAAKFNINEEGGVEDEAADKVIWKYVYLYDYKATNINEHGANGWKWNGANKFDNDVKWKYILEKPSTTKADEPIDSRFDLLDLREE